MKKGRLFLVMLLCMCCIITSMPVTAAENGSSIGGGELTEDEKEYWENMDWGSIELSDLMPDNSNEQSNISDNDIMLLSSNGQWIQEANGLWWYRHWDGSYTTNGWESINGKWFYFDASGWMVTGWIYYNGAWYYLYETGEMMTGWIYVNGVYYYCNESGAMQTGWVNTGGVWYYCNETSGAWIDNTGTKMIQEAFKYLGNPYVYGGNSLTNGVDCSGYTQQISLLFGISIPRTSSSQYASSSKISASSAMPGDMVFTAKSGSSTVSHVAFYVGKVGGNYNCILHAANSTEGIILSGIRGNVVGYGTYWR